MKGLSVAASLLGAVFAFAGAAAYLLSDDPGWLPLVNLALGVVLIAGAAVATPPLLRQYGQWLSAFWGGIMVLAIVGMVNFLASRYPQRLDVTAGQLHSLSGLTIQTLEGLESPIEALAFVEAGKNESLEGLLEQYASHSTRFDFEMIDLDRDPDRALEEYGVTSYNALMLVSGGRQQRVTELTEKAITNAVLKLLQDRDERVYLTVGHGEKGLGSGAAGRGGPGTEGPGLDRLRERLGEINYSVKDSLFLARTRQVPEDCRVLVIAGPTSPFLEPELEAVRDYLERGGAVLLMLDPPYGAELAELVAQWGIVVGDDFVIDTSGIGSLFGLDFTIPVAAAYSPDHPITSKHRAGIMTVYELVRSVRYDGELAQAGSDGADLVLTSDQSWAETDLSVLQPQGGQRTVRLDEGFDREGPISLAAAVALEGGGRLVVFGDSEVASNQYFDLQGNGDLTLNALSWLAEDESLISIRPKQAGHNPITLTASQSDWIFWISVILYPAAIALIGIVVVSRKGRWSFRDLAVAGLGALAALGVVVMVNFMADRYRSRLDLTEEGLFTLAPETVDLLERLDQDERLVTVKTFMGKEEGPRFQELLDEYRYRTRNFQYEVIDPQKEPLQVKQYNIRQRGASVVELSGDGVVHTTRLEEQSEEALSNAVQRALKADDRTVYFTSGHGEGELSQVDGAGFSILGGRLREMNLSVETGLDLATGGPPGPGLVAVLAPKEPFTPGEADQLRAHLQRGGDVLLMLDAGPPTGLEALLSEYGIDLGQDFVVDLSGLGQLLGADVAVPVVISYGRHPIVEKMSQGTMSFFPFARSVMPASGQAEAVALAFTDRNSWGESDLAPLRGEGGEVEFNPQTDRPGPLGLAVARIADADSAEAEGDRARLLVFGDADFASNQYFGQQANGTLLVSGIRWLTEGDDRMTIAARQPKFNPINLMGTEGTTIMWLSVFVLPFAVALSGFVIMLRRGYETYVAGFASWLIYSLAGTAAYHLALAIAGLSEGDWLRGEGYLVLAMAMAASAYGLHRRDQRAWAASLALAVANIGVGFAAVPSEPLQLVWAGLFVANACILVWIKSDFEPAARIS